MRKAATEDNLTILLENRGCLEEVEKGDRKDER